MHSGESHIDGVDLSFATVLDTYNSRYLEDDLSTTVLERRSELVGYEVYIVEQWACSRVDPTFVITTFTGLPHQKVSVGVLGVPTNENEWSPRLRVYLKAIAKFHARKKDTPLGTLMVTNLSGFPSALNVIAVPGGDVRSHREDFIVNEDLKRLDCSGRAGMTLTLPIGATRTKFLQLYRPSVNIPLHSAVIELVKLCQVALVMFTKLASEYADGLLCDVTERAINDWWTEIGTDYFNVEPSDGILGPTTVAALLGMLLGARNRLNAYGAPVGKDVFDLKATKRGIAYFQRSQKIPKTRRLDQLTLSRLHRATSKAANSEGWAVPRAVKSTVAELSGKGGEMVMEMVGARERAGIAEVETLDIGVFISAVSGERCKWLWHGKPRKVHAGDLSGALAGEDEMVFSGDESGGYMWTSRKRDSITESGAIMPGNLDHLYFHTSHGSQNCVDLLEKDQAFRKTMLKSVTGKMSDARSGLGRFKEVVSIPGLRHHNKHARDDSINPSEDKRKQSSLRDSRDHPNTYMDGQSSRHGSATADSNRTMSDPIKNAILKSAKEAEAVDLGTNSHSAAINDLSVFDNSNIVHSPIDVTCAVLPQPHATNVKPLQQSDDRSVGKDEYLPDFRHTCNDPEESFKDDAMLWRLRVGVNPLALQRTQSFCQARHTVGVHGHSHQWPRHLSFSIMDAVLLRRSDLDLPRAEIANRTTKLEDTFAAEHHLSLEVFHMHEQLRKLEARDAVRLDSGVRLVEELNQSSGNDQDDLHMIYYQKLEEQTSLHDAITNLVSEESVSLTEAFKEIDVLGAKLEYEFGALKSKVEDVEDGIADFERQIRELEGRARDLESEGNQEDGWSKWLTIFGVFKT